MSSQSVLPVKPRYGYCKSEQSKEPKAHDCNFTSEIWSEQPKPDEAMELHRGVKGWEAVWGYVESERITAQSQRRQVDPPTAMKLSITWVAQRIRDPLLVWQHPILPALLNHCHLVRRENEPRRICSQMKPRSLRSEQRLPNATEMKSSDFWLFCDALEPVGLRKCRFLYLLAEYSIDILFKVQGYRKYNFQTKFLLHHNFQAFRGRRPFLINKILAKLSPQCTICNCQSEWFYC